MIDSIKELKEGFRSQKFSPKDITRWYMDRVKKYDKQIHSYITISEEKAIFQAETLEKNMQIGEEDNVIGVPISLKDNIHMKDFVTTNGSIIDQHNISQVDAAVVTTLDEEGCIFLGKNNMYEYAFGITSKNPFYGDIINPWNKLITAGGSSGGSAASVAANFCLGSIGTDTAGSIRVPSSCCGVIGLKPTYNLVEMNGITPLSWTLDHVGPITRNVEDNALLLASLTGTSYKNSFIQDLNGVKIGLPNYYFNENSDEEVRHVFNQTIEQLRSLGANIIDVDTSFFSDVLSTARTFGTSEVGMVHKERIETSIDLYSEGARKTFNKSRNITAHEYLTALKKREEWIENMSKIFSKVDVMITPTLPIVPPDVNMHTVNVSGLTESIDDCLVRFTSPFNITGNPALTVPMGLSKQNIPIGLQLVADHFKEVDLFRVAYAYEQNFLFDFYANRENTIKKLTEENSVK